MIDIHLTNKEANAVCRATDRLVDGAGEVLSDHDLEALVRVVGKIGKAGPYKRILAASADGWRDSAAALKEEAALAHPTTARHGYLKGVAAGLELAEAQARIVLGSTR